MKRILLLLALLVAARVASAQSSPMHDVLLRYYDVKNALTKDNFDTAKAATTRFTSSLAVKTADAGQTDLLKKLARHSTAMRSSTNIETLRGAFRQVSKDMTTLIERYHINGADTAYLQYCSMQKAYWISSSEEVRNPYYGKKMLFCGKTMKTYE